MVSGSAILREVSGCGLVDCELISGFLERIEGVWMDGISLVAVKVSAM